MSNGLVGFIIHLLNRLSMMIIDDKIFTVNMVGEVLGKF